MKESGKVSGGGNRDARLKQALKSNLQRRKAQARARATENDKLKKVTEGGTQPDEGSEQNG